MKHPAYVCYAVCVCVVCVCAREYYITGSKVLTLLQ
jgi:hypothetical protein